MDHLPVFLNLKGKPALVVGATPSAWRRAAWLSRADAAVTLVTHDGAPTEAGSETAVTLAERAFLDSDLDGIRVVCIATGNRDEDAAHRRAGGIARPSCQCRRPRRPRQFHCPRHHRPRQRDRGHRPRGGLARPRQRTPSPDRRRAAGPRGPHRPVRDGIPSGGGNLPARGRDAPPSNCWRDPNA